MKLSMLSRILYLFLIVLFSCNNSSKENNANNNSKYSNSDSQIENLAKIANDHYENKEYSEAKLCYDQLILLDSTKGGYYFKRGYCKAMSLNDDKGAIADYLKSIERNYSKKQTAYLNIGVLHRGNAVFKCATDEDRIVEYDSALYFYNECLKIEPNNTKALQEKEEVNDNLKRLRR